MTGSDDSRNRWKRIALADHHRLCELMREWIQIPEDERLPVLRDAIRVPHERGAALRLLLGLGSSVSMQLFSDLVDSASVGHSDIWLCRTVLKALPRKWVVDRIEAVVQPLIDRHPGDEEVFRRLTELCEEFDPGLVQKLARQGLLSEDAGIREAAIDLIGLGDLHGE